MIRQGAAAVSELLTRHGLTPRKAYGQHFLTDPNTVDRVVALARVTGNDRVLEVGAGTGALTSALAATGARVISYELDERLRPVLAETLAGIDVDLRFADITDVDLVAELVEPGWKLVANLPYNIGTTLVLDVLEGVPQVSTLVVMLQREVVDRLVAAVGTPDYGLPSIVVALTASVEERFNVGTKVFLPAPRVGSAVVRLVRTPPPPGWERAIEISRVAFRQRRKMLRRSLAGLASGDQLGRAGIDPTLRPENLTPEMFVALAEVVDE